VVKGWRSSRYETRFSFKSANGKQVYDLRAVTDQLHAEHRPGRPCWVKNLIENIVDAAEMLKPRGALVRDENRFAHLFLGLRRIYILLCERPSVKDKLVAHAVRQSVSVLNIMSSPYFCSVISSWILPLLM